MKKTLVATTVIAAMLVSGVAFAGFGLPKVPKASPAPAATSTTTETAKVDISDLTNKQGKVLKMMAGALVASANANYEVRSALGIVDKDKLAASAILDNKSAQTAAKEIAKTQVDTAKVNDMAKNGTAEQKETLKNAMNKANYHKYEAYAYYLMAVKEGSAMASEASKTLKNVKDIDQINKLNAIVKTGQLTTTLYDESKKQFEAYDNGTKEAKSLLNVSDAKPEIDLGNWDK